MSNFGDDYAYGDYYVDQFTGDGSTTTFNLTYNPGRTGAIEVVVGGIPQNPANYTLFGLQLILSFAPNAGEAIWVRHLGRRVAVPVPALQANDIDTALGFTPVSSSAVRAFNGDVTGSGSFSASAISLSLVTTGITAGTYNHLVFDSKGRATNYLSYPDRVNVCSWGAVGDAKSISSTITVSANSAVLTVASAAFSSTDVGKTITFLSTTNSAHYLVSATITTVTSATQITISSNITFAMSAELCAISYGTDNSAAFTAAITFMSSQNANSGVGGYLYVPKGNYLKTTTTLLPSRTTMEGDGNNSIIIQCYGSVAIINQYYVATASYPFTAADNNITLSNIAFYQAGNVQPAVAFNSTASVAIKNCVFAGPPYAAVHSLGVVLTSCSAITISQCTFNTFYDALLFEGVCNEIYLINNIFTSAFNIAIGLMTYTTTSPAITTKSVKSYISDLHINGNDITVTNNATCLYAVPPNADSLLTTIQVSNNNFNSLDAPLSATNTAINIRAPGYYGIISDNTLQGFSGDNITVAALWFNTNKALTNPFSTSNTVGGYFTATTYVKVNDPNHGLVVGDIIYVSNSSTPVGGLSLGGGAYPVVTIIDTNNYMIVAPSSATSTATGGGNVNLNYYIGNFVSIDIKGNVIVNPNPGALTSYNNPGAGSVINVQGWNHNISGNSVYTALPSLAYNYLVYVDNQWALNTTLIPAYVSNNIGAVGTLGRIGWPSTVGDQIPIVVDYNQENTSFDFYSPVNVKSGTLGLGALVLTNPTATSIAINGNATLALESDVTNVSTRLSKSFSAITETYLVTTSSSLAPNSSVTSSLTVVPGTYNGFAVFTASVSGVGNYIPSAVGATAPTFAMYSNGVSVCVVVAYGNVSRTVFQPISAGSNTTLSLIYSNNPSATASLPATLLDIRYLFVPTNA